MQRSIELRRCVQAVTDAEKKWAESKTDTDYSDDERNELEATLATARTKLEASVTEIRQHQELRISSVSEARALAYVYPQLEADRGSLQLIRMGAVGGLQNTRTARQLLEQAGFNSEEQDVVSFHFP